MEKKKILQAKEVVKIYGSDPKNQVTALDHVSLDVFEGDFITIMGPSGAGKSTFLNNISTIDLPTSGSVKINGTVLLFSLYQQNQDCILMLSF